jgi:heptosyltransferase-2
MGLRRKGKEIQLSQAKHVLVVRLDDIGDMVLTTPFLRELRRNIPYANITLIVDPRVYNLVETCPYVNEVLTFGLRIAVSFGKLITHLEALKLAFLHLWKKKFDLAILPRWGCDFYNDSLVAYFSGAAKRVAYSENVNSIKQRLNKGCDKLFTHLKLDKTLKCELEHGLEIIDFIGGKIEDDSLELWLDEDDVSFAKSIIENNNIDNNYFLIGMGLGAPSLRKIWPVENYLNLIQWLLEKIDCKLMLFGNTNEAHLGRYVERNLEDSALKRIINIIGKTTLRQAASLLKYCKLYIGNDAGLIHMAAAMRVPVIEISCWPKNSQEFMYSPLRFAPWKVRHIVVNPERPLPPCAGECLSSESHCILQITVEDVKKAINQLLFQCTDIPAK